MSEIDSQFLLLINGFHTGYLDQLMWLISGKLVWIPFYLITLFVIYKKRGWKGALHLLVLVGVMMLMTDMVNSQVIRPWFHRLRPANLENPLSQYVHIVNDYRGGSYGFPSAHAANYWGLSLLVAWFMKSRRVLYSLFSLSLIVCYSRSYLGVHYPGDLLGGILYSTIVVGIIIWLYQKYLPEKSRGKGMPIHNGMDSSHDSTCHTCGIRNSGSNIINEKIIEYRYVISIFHC